MGMFEPFNVNVISKNPVNHPVFQRTIEFIQYSRRELRGGSFDGIIAYNFSHCALACNLQTSQFNKDINLERNCTLALIYPIFFIH